MTKILVGLNVLLDVIQRREPHYPHSAGVLSRIAAGELDGAVPSHALTTIHYVVSRLDGVDSANRAVDWLLGRLEVIPEGSSTFLRARSLDVDDFEDAVVASAAEQARCHRIVTRNVEDFRNSPVAAVTPRELEAELSEPSG